MATVAGVVLATGLVSTGPAQAAPACTFYVSASGSDGNAGTSPDRPWASLERARDHIRQRGLNKNMRADLGVCLRGGRHTRTATFNLAEADSGSNGFKVVYRAAPGETPIIDGGKAVTGWNRVADRPYFVADVPEPAGYADYFRQLYVGGQRAQLAMGKGIVGNGFFDEASIPNPPANPERPTRSYDGVQFPAASVPAYTNVRDIRLLHIAIGFKIDYFPVVDISTSGANKRVRLAQPHFQARLNRDDGFSLDYDDTFYVLNAFEELDSPGEWYLNRATNKVYYYPRAGEDVNRAGAYVPVVETLVNVAGSSPSAKASAIAFDGITFEHGNWLLPRDRFIGGTQAEAQYADDPFKDPNHDGYGGEVPGQIKLTNTRGITFSNNTVRKMGNGGLQLLTGAEDVTVTGNTFHNLTAAGVIAGRWMDVHVDGARRTRNVKISNNVVTDIGDDFFPATGISLMNTYNVAVTHNLVYDTAFMGFHQRKAEELSLLDGVDGIGKTTFSHNEVYNATSKASWGVRDSGAVYSFGSWPGSVISHNYVHHGTSTANYYSDNQSHQTRWDYNVGQGGRFDFSPRYRKPLSVYASHNYTDFADNWLSGAIYDGDGRPHVVTGGAWPAEARTIMNQAGLEPKYAPLRWKVPRENLADHSTLSQRSDWDSGLGKLWDGVTETGEAASTANESWVQFDLGADYERLSFTIQQDNCCTWMATDWKVQRWSAGQNAWLDIMPYQAISTTAPVVYRPPADVATANIRLYVRNSNQDGSVGVQEFSATGVRK
ncbi:right-handed parallel beta-helix repeat-containing protein [Crossiella sp. SN42]|uniref:right-handed parallel beta-helix repeat-containing protein n=1 Tax=Crossiella sp. SN42 TaxID=2944808 RepID=UPI00207D0A8D|nr:right-handed parallel beta-helix repeat-containing protein [Crossiella sp. SN42]MCO1574155.1 right-handed parallel beta-helix repeat-containing protein [Crossiella sp. SN42]